MQTQDEIKMSQRDQIKLVREAYEKLSRVFYSKSTNYAEQALDQAESEEKGHRGFGSDFSKYHPNAAKVVECAMMFTISRVAEFLCGAKLPRGKQYLHCQKSWFTCAGIADEYRKEIRKAWRGLDIKQLAELDYIDFVSPEKRGCL